MGRSGAGAVPVHGSHSLTGADTGPAGGRYCQAAYSSTARPGSPPTAKGCSAKPRPGALPQPSRKPPPAGAIPQVTDGQSDSSGGSRLPVARSDPAQPPAARSGKSAGAPADGKKVEERAARSRRGVRPGRRPAARDRRAAGAARRAVSRSGRTAGVKSLLAYGDRQARAPVRSGARDRHPRHATRADLLGHHQRAPRRTGRAGGPRARSPRSARERARMVGPLRRADRRSAPLRVSARAHTALRPRRRHRTFRAWTSAGQRDRRLLRSPRLVRPPYRCRLPGRVTLLLQLRLLRRARI